MYLYKKIYTIDEHFKHAQQFMGKKKKLLLTKKKRFHNLYTAKIKYGIYLLDINVHIC